MKRIEVKYYGPGHINWRLKWAFGKRDLGNAVILYCGLIAVTLWRY